MWPLVFAKAFETCQLGSWPSSAQKLLATFSTRENPGSLRELMLLHSSLKAIRFFFPGGESNGPIRLWLRPTTPSLLHNGLDSDSRFPYPSWISTGWRITQVKRCALFLHMGPQHEAVVMKCDGILFTTTTISKKSPCCAVSIQYIIRMGFNSKHTEKQI